VVVLKKTTPSPTELPCQFCSKLSENIHEFISGLSLIYVYLYINPHCLDHCSFTIPTDVSFYKTLNTLSLFKIVQDGQREFFALNEKF
jgi:hypothetical protein